MCWHRPCCCHTHIPQHTFAVFEHFPGIGACADVFHQNLHMLPHRLNPPPHRSWINAHTAFPFVLCVVWLLSTVSCKLVTCLVSWCNESWFTCFYILKLGITRKHSVGQSKLCRITSVKKQTNCNLQCWGVHVDAQTFLKSRYSKWQVGAIWEYKMIQALL